MRSRTLSTPKFPVAQSHARVCRGCRGAADLRSYQQARAGAGALQGACSGAALISAMHSLLGLFNGL